MSMYIVAQFHAKAGCENQLNQTLLGIVGPTRAEPGCLEIHLYRALRDPATFFIHSAWVDDEAFEQHATLPHMTAFLSEVPQWMDHEVRALRCSRMA
jgi:quinol monooxygenase YgiN